jgi:multidrug efflux pump subunit AcrA (membrane-fusion protein)
MVFDVPESDFDVVVPGAAIGVHVVATDKTLGATISRRSPSADPDTRTVHCEADMPNASRDIPVNTTGEVRIDVGKPSPATAVPLASAAITGVKAAVFVVEGDVAHKRTFKILGERGGTVYLDGGLRPGTQVVTEGRAVLADGDAVAPKMVAFGAEDREDGSREAKE